MERFTISSIGDVAIAFGVGIITVALVAMILGVMGQGSVSGTLTSVANKTFDNTTTLTVQLGLVSYTVYNDTTQLFALPSTNFTVNTATGALNVTDNTARLGGDESVAYSYYATNNATSVIAKGVTAVSAFADWFIILVIVVVAIIVLGLLQYVRNRGGGEA